MSVLSVCCKSHDSIRKFRKFCWTLANTGLCPTSSSIVNRQQLNILQCGLLVGVEFNAPLDTQERVRFKMAVLMYKATHGTAPSYLSQLVRVADLPCRRSLRSARTNRLLVPPVKLSTVGGRAFPVAGPTIWNSLPDSVISAPSLSTFRQRLKTFLFQASFPDIITDPQ